MYKILIAEDESIERRMLRKTLERRFAGEVTLLEAKNGREALELALEEKPRVAILDINMPGMTGLEAAMQIRRERINCVIIFLTAYDNFDYARQAIAVRALDYLLKPYDEGELMACVEAAMHLSDKLARNRLYLDYFCMDEAGEPVQREDRGENERLSQTRDSTKAVDHKANTTQKRTERTSRYGCKNRP